MDSARDWFLETMQAIGIFVVSMAFIAAVMTGVLFFLGAFASGFAAIFR